MRMVASTTRGTHLASLGWALTKPTSPQPNNQATRLFGRLRCSCCSGASTSTHEATTHTYSRPPTHSIPACADMSLSRAGAPYYSNGVLITSPQGDQPFGVYCDGMQGRGRARGSLGRHLEPLTKPHPRLQLTTPQLDAHMHDTQVAAAATTHHTSHSVISAHTQTQTPHDA